MEPDPLRACTPEQLVKFSIDTTTEPDKEFRYNNANYILLGMLIEKVTNNSLSNQMKRRILQPLGMSHTFMLTELKMPAPYAHGYLYEEGKAIDATFSIHPSLFWTAGGIVSTAADQLIWARALLEGRLLSPQAHSEQFNMKAVSGKLRFYGLGTANMDGLIGHGGNVNNMYTCFVGRYHGYDVAILVNGQTGDAEEKTFRAKPILERVFKEAGL
jgi:D-alanyl-D-alanine carboxypeptidase